MTKHRGRLAIVLAIALAALGGSVAWSVSRGGGPGMWSHHNGRGAWMMGYVPAGATAPARTIDDARHNAQAFADRLGLKVDEVMQFERNFYAKLTETNGDGATEVLVDPPSGAVSLEYGPAMMWNTKYGFHGGRHGTGGMMGGTTAGGMMGSGAYGPGMMGGRYGTTRSGSVTIDQARTLAQRWLDANEHGITAEPGGDRFPGYYTFETMNGDRIDGMISVNASTGAVWPHWWHGAFVAAS